MAGSINKVILVGNIGNDPEIRTTNTGSRVAQLSVATSERWRDRQSGEMQDKTEWHRVVIFNENLIDVAERYLRKGSKIYCEGQLQTRKWQDQSGQDRYTTEVVLGRFKSELALLDRRSDSDSIGYDNAPSPKQASSPGGFTPKEAPAAQLEEFDDEIPF